MRTRSFTILKKPYLSEKSYLQGQLFNTYTFVIERGATKTEVKEDVEKLFNVEVASVKTIKGRDKKKRMGKYSGIKRGKRKALVTLKEGFTLDFFGEVEKTETPKDEKIAKKELKEAKKIAKKEEKENKESKKVEKTENKKTNPKKESTKNTENEEVKDAG